MRVTWHERKRTSNLRDHGFDFRDARRVFEGPTYTFEDDRLDYDEERFLTLGFLDGTVVSIVHTESPLVIRAISFRRATRREEAILFQSLKN